LQNYCPQTLFVVGLRSVVVGKSHSVEFTHCHFQGRAVFSLTAPGVSGITEQLAVDKIVYK